MNALFSVDRGDACTVYTLEVDSASLDEILDLLRAWLDLVTQSPAVGALATQLDQQSSQLATAVEANTPNP